MQLIILGMHRSGTSMQTRLLNLAGAYFGPEGSSTGANDENPKGFWERVEARRLNDAVLFSTGHDWNRVRGFTVAGVPVDASKAFDEGARRLTLDMDGHRPWALKEPRLCLLMPLWRKHLEVPVAIHVFRHPLEVASSLQRRDNIPVDVGLVLWKFYVASAIEGARGIPTVTSFHADLISDPYRSIGKLVGDLGDAGVSGLRVPSRREVEAFVSRDLYRQRLENIRPGVQVDAAPYEALFDSLRSDGIPDAEILLEEAELERLRQYESTLPALGRETAAPPKSAALLQAEKSIAELRAALKVRQSRLEAAQAMVEQLSRSSDVLARELDGGRTQIEFARKEMQAALRREGDLAREAEELRRTAAELTERVRVLEAESARLAQELQAERDGGGEIDRLRAENLRLQSDYTSASIQVERVEAAIAGERAALERRTFELARATRLLMSRDDTIGEQARKLDELDTVHQNFRRKYALQAKDLKALREAHEALARRHQTEVDELSAELAALRGSAAWKVTAPIRWLMRRVRRQRDPGFARDRELVVRSGLFDAKWYRSTYPDVATSGMDPAEHYLLHGAEEGRDPGPSFGTRAYRETYADVAASGMNPLVHFLRHGRAEGRVAK